MKRRAGHATPRVLRNRPWRVKRRRDSVQAVERAVASVRDGVLDGRLGYLERIEQRRRTLEASDAKILVPRSEYSGDPADTSVETLGVREACFASVGPRWGALLYALVRELSPKAILELGTNLGISTSYLAAAVEEKGSGTVVSGEASSGRLAIARETLASVQLSNRVHLVHGRFHDTLPHMLERLGRVEFAFVDGHHDEEATVRYVDTIAGAAAEDAVFVIDDIRWSDGMTRAWHVIGSRPDVGAVIDLEAMGIVVRGWERRELSLAL